MVQPQRGRNRQALLDELNPGMGQQLPGASQMAPPGLPGGTAMPGAAPPAPTGLTDALPEPAAVKPDYSAWGQYRPEGLDQSKIDRGHDSPKYQIGRVLSHFDPQQGITSDALAALNTLGIGTFAGGGEDLRVGGQSDPRFKDVLSADVVRNFTRDPNNPNESTAWMGWGGGNAAGAPAGGGPPMGGAPQMAGGIGGAQLDPQLGGDPMARIQEALAKINSSGRVNLDALLQQLQGV